MVRVCNTRMHDIVMSFIPKKNGGGPAPIFKGSVPTLKPQIPGGGSLTKPSSLKTTSSNEKAPVLKSGIGGPSVRFEKQPTVVEKLDSNPNKQQQAPQTITDNTKEPVEKNDSLDTIADENIKVSKKKKNISATKTLIENLIDQKLKKSYINNIISKTNTQPSSAKHNSSAVINRSRSSSANIKKYNQHFLSTKMFDVEPKQTEKSFREVAFKIDGKKERRSRRKKSRDGKKKSRDEKHKKKSNIKIKQSTPPNLRNDLEKIIDGVSIG